MSFLSNTYELQFLGLVMASVLGAFFEHRHIRTDGQDPAMDTRGGVNHNAD